MTIGIYNNVVTAKTKKTKRQRALRSGESRPVACTLYGVVDWFKSKGPCYQTRIKRIFRRVMMESKKRTSEK